MSKIFKASLIIGIAFGLNKILGFLRQYLVASQFGFSSQMDAFNVANNLPDLIFSLFSGGALAMAFIPVFAEYVQIQGIHLSWKLFSRVATLTFLLTAAASVLVAIFAPYLVSSQLGIAPGFTSESQQLVVSLLRINLLATLIFSVSGLVMAALQAHKHFLLPALAPIFYNLGIIIGAIILSPSIPFKILGFTLPAYGLGIYGLTYGVVFGALLHLLIQIPGLLRYQFRFSFSFSFKDEGIRKMLRLMGPRVLTVLLIQLMFLLKDNFASRLETGSVTALTYGYFIMQVPETLIATSIATALLPTLSAQIAGQKRKEFILSLNKALRILMAFSIGSSVIIAMILAPAIETIFNFSSVNDKLLIFTTYAFLIGLPANSLLEILVRAFYAKQNAAIPLYATGLRAAVFVVFGFFLYRQFGTVGIASIDSLAVGVEAIILFILLLPMISKKEITATLGRSIIGIFIVAGIGLAIFFLPFFGTAIKIGITMILGTTIYMLLVKKEIELLVKL